MDILDIIREYNLLMAKSTKGPNCIDPNICHGDCCHIFIDIPKRLAEFYIDNNIGTKENFLRGDIFSFKIAVRKKDSKCIFYDDKINGCSIHHTNMKPPQCWIYPTGFSNDKGEEKQFDEEGTIKCKRAKGWMVIDLEKAKKASNLLKDYKYYSESEFFEENSTISIEKRLDILPELLKKKEPSKIAGIKDTWDKFIPLDAEGLSLSLKRICGSIHNKKSCNFLECKEICQSCIDCLMDILRDKIIRYIGEKGPKQEYVFFELFSL